MISVISSFSDSTTGENTTTGCVNRLFVTFCDMSQKAIDTTGYGPRSCGVLEAYILVLNLKQEHAVAHMSKICAESKWKIATARNEFGATAAWRCLNSVVAPKALFALEISGVEAHTLKARGDDLARTAMGLNPGKGQRMPPSVAVWGDPRYRSWVELAAARAVIIMPVKQNRSIINLKRYNQALHYG